MSEIYKFPDDFVFSTATAAYQIEGAANEDGRGPSIWDTFCKIPGKIQDGSSGEIACDSYHKFREDVRLLNELGVQQYRFSLSWSRLLPSGLRESANDKGVAYYNELIDELLAAGIEPVVTIFHWDLPQALQDRGGWLNSHIIEWFTDYARFVFENFASKVKTWITLNEPFVHVSCGHGKSMIEHAPGGLQDHSHWSVYQVGHNMLLAHASAYHVYQKEFKELYPGSPTFTKDSSQEGKIGLSNVALWMEPSGEGHSDAAERAFAMNFGWFCHPIFTKEGDYPPLMREQVEKISKEEGRVTSRLPSFTEVEKKLLRGSADFLGVNYYITLQATELEGESAFPLMHLDVRATAGYHEDWKKVGGEDSWIRQTPHGLRAVLNFIRENYQNIPVLITENGCIDTPGEGLEDVTRIEYIQEHLIAIAQALTDGCNVRGYTVWTLIDNFEWTMGYKSLFGLHHVDFSDPERKRTPKKSALWFREVIKTRTVTRN